MAMYFYDKWILIAYCVFFACIYGVWKANRKGQSPLDDVPGPQPESFILGTNNSSLTKPPVLWWLVCAVLAGNLRQLMREQVGSYDTKWQELYGMVARIKGPFGVRHVVTFSSRGATQRPDWEN